MNENFLAFCRSFKDTWSPNGPRNNFECLKNFSSYSRPHKNTGPRSRSQTHEPQSDLGLELAKKPREYTFLF